MSEVVVVWLIVGYIDFGTGRSFSRDWLEQKTGIADVVLIIDRKASFVFWEYGILRPTWSAFLFWMTSDSLDDGYAIQTGVMKSVVPDWQQLVS